MREDNSPKHYTDCKIEPIEFILANKMSFLEGNIIKYITRYGRKDGIKDLIKAEQYLKWLIQENEEDKTETLDEITDDEVLDYHVLIGKTFREIIVGDDSISFRDEGANYVLLHKKKCCEKTTVLPTVGSFKSIEGKRITNVIKTVEEYGEDYKSRTETTYKILVEEPKYYELRVTFCVESNGRYSEQISIIKE